MKRLFLNDKWYLRLMAGLYSLAPRPLNDSISLTYATGYKIRNILRLGYTKNVLSLRRSQWWSREKLEEYQAERLKNLIKYAYENVPYYKKMFQKESIKPETIRCLEDLQKLPTLNKESVANNFDRLISRKFYNKKFSRFMTSGTTGKPLMVAWDVDYSLFLGAVKTRHYSYNNSRFYQNKVQFGGSIMSAVIHQTDVRSEYNPCNRTLFLSSSNLSDQVLQGYVTKIREYYPSFIRGTGSAVYLLASFLKDNDINDIKVNSFTNRSETLSDYQRKLIQERLHCDVYNFYSQVEEVCSAMDCSKHEGMHIDMEKGIIEIQNSSTSRSGEIIATGLNNYVMPLIRYETGDLGSLSKKQCSCGRGLVLLKEVFGRKNEIMHINKKVVHPLEFGTVIKPLNHIKECQFVQESDTEILIRVVKRKEYAKEDEKRLLTNISNLLGRNVCVHIEYADEIERTKSGKFQFVVSHARS